MLSRGRELRDRRELLGCSQKALAESISTSRKFIVELEAGKKTSKTFAGLPMRCASSTLRSRADRLCEIR
ncbi:helix-turn-helix domain-containing protein [Paeniglutamicibacter sp. NPDC012692]|uniref:helix-turn-helix domain-containing protein n=1 Tax=Paeniglutamicibacter sp. NPDC012692 TaxID=3364388 RepID=UPI0036B68D0D